MRLFSVLRYTIAWNFSATTVSRGYPESAGAGKSSNAGYVMSCASGVMTSPKPTSSCIVTRALPNRAMKRTRTPS